MKDNKYTTYIVTRHQGAIEWLKQHHLKEEDIKNAVVLSHFELNKIWHPAKVIGTLPIHLVEVICRNGGTYHNLTMDLPPEARGKEITAEDMSKYNAKLQQFHVESWSDRIYN